MEAVIEHKVTRFEHCSIKRYTFIRIYLFIYLFFES